MLAAAPASAADEPVTAAADSLRTGWYPENGQLTPQLLEEKGGFGRNFDTPVQGQVYAQPLVFGHTLLAATEDNWIYGIDPQSGAIRWSRKVGTPWNSADIGCTDLEPRVGITGTPVIDPETNVAYFFSKAYASGNSGAASGRCTPLTSQMAKRSPVSRYRSPVKRRISPESNSTPPSSSSVPPCC